MLEGAELSGAVQRPELNAVVAALELDPAQTEELVCELERRGIEDGGGRPLTGATSSKCREPDRRPAFLRAPPHRSRREDNRFIQSGRLVKGLGCAESAQNFSQTGRLKR